MSKLCCKPKKGMSIGSFIEPESNVNLQAKRRKVPENKTVLPKITSIKTMFTKILSPQDANDEIEIDSD